MFCKKNVLKIFRKITKKPVVGSCFSKVTGFSFLPAPLLKWGTTKGVWKTSAQHSLFLEAQTFIPFRYIKSQIGSNSKTSKNLNMVSHFHWNHFYQCYFFPRILFFFSQFYFIFCRRWELIKMFLPKLTSLKYMQYIFNDLCNILCKWRWNLSFERKRYF